MCVETSDARNWFSFSTGLKHVLGSMVHVAHALLRVAVLAQDLSPRLSVSLAVLSVDSKTLPFHPFASTMSLISDTDMAAIKKLEHLVQVWMSRIPNPSPSTFTLDIVPPSLYGRTPGFLVPASAGAGILQEAYRKR